MQEKILERLRLLHGLETESEAMADYAAGRSLELIKAYCNIEEVPEELLGVAVSLAEWLLESRLTGEKAVKRIEEGDISVQFADGLGAGMTEDEMTAHFWMELERFRRLPG